MSRLPLASERHCTNPGGGGASRNAGHAAILREQLDGAVGTDEQSTAGREYDAAYRKNLCASVEQAARADDPASA